MYKDRAKQREADRERQRRYRASKSEKSLKQPISVKTEAVESPTIDEVCHAHTKLPSQSVTGVTELKGVTVPDMPLPEDNTLECNADITWDDVLRLSRNRIDEIYQVWYAVGGDILLRLKRAAGYYKRTGIA
jgi:hypothetical protein